MDAIRKTIYEDKRIDETLLDGRAFDFALKNFEDPIDTIEFLDLVISARSEDKEMEEAIDESFIAMVSDKISILRANQAKTLLSLVVTDRIPDISRLTTLPEDAINKAIDDLQTQGLVHRRGEATVLPLYLKNLKKPGLLIGVVERMGGMIGRNEFDEIEEFYFRILKEIKPKEEMIEQPAMRAETMWAISYPFPEIDELDKLVLSLKASFMDAVSKDIENSDRPIEIVDEVLFKTIDEQTRGIALSVRALAYMKKGSLEESRRDIDAAYNINSEVLNLLVPFYLSYGNLYRERAKYKEAAECYNRALKVAEESGDGLGTSQALIGTAEVRLEQAKYVEADELVREGLKIAKGIGDSGRGVVARALSSLGAIQYNTGDVEQAIKYFEQALSIDRDVYGEMHPDVATLLYNIGSSWYYLGKPRKAIGYYEQALSIDRDVYGEMHPAVARDLNNIGMVWYVLGEQKKAIRYFDQALSIDREVYGKRHPVVATNLSNMGLVQDDLGEPKKAIGYYEQALSIVKGVYEEKHPYMATYLNNIGGSWKALGELRKAIEYYEQALLIGRDVYGGRHPAVARDLNNIGMAWRALGDLRRASTCLQQAYSIFQEFYGDGHPSTRNVKELLDALNK